MKLVNRSILFLIIFAFGNAFAEKVIDFTEYSRQYNIQLILKECDKKASEEACKRDGSISFKHLGSANNFQTIQIGEGEIDFDHLVYNPLKNLSLREKNIGGGSFLILDDFNFDGLEDIAIRGINQAGYGGAAYSVYLYNKPKGLFILNNELTSLTEDTLGLFQVINKQIVAYSKNGCCQHSTSKFNMVNNSLVLVESIDEEVKVNIDESMTRTIKTRSLLNDKWKENIQIIPIPHTEK